MILKRSCNGIAPTSLYLEESAYITTVYYSYLRGSPLSTYGDQLSATVQVAAMMVLMWWYTTPSLTGIISANYLVLSLWSVFFAALLVTPPERLHMIITYAIVVKIICKLPQIYSNYSLKSTGVQSLASMAIALFGTFVKLFIVQTETPNDWYLVTGALLNMAFTAVLFAQGIFYLNSGRSGLPAGDVAHHGTVITGRGIGENLPSGAETQSFGADTPSRRVLRRSTSTKTDK